MSLTKRKVLGALAGTVAFICLWAVNASAQTVKPAGPPPVDRDQTLQQLLTEVRALRLALEHATLANTRFQMLIERLKTQQTQVDSLDRQLLSARAESIKLKEEKNGLESRSKSLEGRLSGSSDEEHRAIEEALKEIKSRLELLASEEPQRLQTESELTLRLQLEQSKLSDINGQLDLLLKEMSAH